MLGLASPGHVYSPGGQDSYLFNGPALIPIVEIIGQRKWGVVAIGSLRPYADEMVGIFERQLLNKNSIDHAEDRSVGRNANRQRDHGYSGKAGSSCQRS